MVKQPVRLKVISDTALSADAQMYRTPGALCVKAEKDGSRYIIEYSGDMLKVETHGELDYVMEFVLGRKSVCDVKTPYGQTTLSYRTIALDHFRTETGHCWKAEYSLAGDDNIHKVEIAVESGKEEPQI